MVFLGIFFYRVESSNAIYIVNSSKRFYHFYVENAAQRSLTRGLWYLRCSLPTRGYTLRWRVHLKGLNDFLPPRPPEGSREGFLCPVLMILLVNKMLFLLTFVG